MSLPRSLHTKLSMINSNSNSPSLLQDRPTLPQHFNHQSSASVFTTQQSPPPETVHTSSNALRNDEVSSMSMSDTEAEENENGSMKDAHVSGELQQEKGANDLKQNERTPNIESTDQHTSESSTPTETKEETEKEKSQDDDKKGNGMADDPTAVKMSRVNLPAVLYHPSTHTVLNPTQPLISSGDLDVQGDSGIREDWDWTDRSDVDAYRQRVLKWGKCLVFQVSTLASTRSNNSVSDLESQEDRLDYGRALITKVYGLMLQVLSYFHLYLKYVYSGSQPPLPHSLPTHIYRMTRQNILHQRILSYI